jgi:hypothetical protein
MKDSTPTTYREKLFSFTKSTHATQCNPYNIFASKDLQVFHVLIHDVSPSSLGQYLKFWTQNQLKYNPTSNSKVIPSSLFQIYRLMMKVILYKINFTQHNFIIQALS